MHQIRPWLYVGGLADAANADTLRQAGIGAVLQLAAPVSHPAMQCLFIPVDDGMSLSADKLRQGVGFIRREKAAGRAVLVSCAMGISRSVTFATAALKEEENLSVVDALRAVQAAHPRAMPHDKLFASLCEYYGAAGWPPTW
jgi:hypothetical protein